MLSFIGDLFITILAVCVIGFMVLCAIITAFRTPPAPPKDTRSRKEIYESYIIIAFGNVSRGTFF